MRYFLSCDWGTSSFRLRLIETDTLKIVAEIKTNEGISDTYKAWQKQPQADRKLFYSQIILAQIEALRHAKELQGSSIDLSRIPVVLSGMASSTIGLIDMPYKDLPFKLDGSDLNVRVEKQHGSDHPLIIISGARTAIDVMRGEETKVIGCSSYFTDDILHARLILPGTHAKHIFVEGLQVKAFKTYMTGEFFDLLSGHGVLSASVQMGADLNDPTARESFTDGVKEGAGGHLLNAAFMVRTRQVLRQLPRQHNYHYLSGMLIGYELKEVDSNLPLFLVGGALHTDLYALACEALGLPIAIKIDADEALIRGQRQIIAAGGMV